MELQVRIGGPGDAGPIAAVLADSFAEFVDLYTPEGFAATTPSAEQIRSRMAEGPTWIAALEGDVVGTVSAVRKGAAGLYVRGMAVLPSARGNHVGADLLDAVCRFAIDNGCSRLFLSTTPFLTSAIRLYERFGFERTDDGPHDLFGTPLVTMSMEVKGWTPDRSSQVSGVRKIFSSR